MVRDPKAMMIAAVSLFALGVAAKLLIPRDLPWRIPGGWPLGSHYYRCDIVAFRACISAAVVAAFLAMIRAFARVRS
jgi:hypothetical protein